MRITGSVNTALERIAGVLGWKVGTEGSTVTLARPGDPDPYVKSGQGSKYKMLAYMVEVAMMPPKVKGLGLDAAEIQRRIRWSPETILVSLKGGGVRETLLHQKGLSDREVEVLERLIREEVRTQAGIGIPV